MKAEASVFMTLLDLSLCTPSSNCSFVSFIFYMEKAVGLTASTYAKKILTLVLQCNVNITILLSPMSQTSALSDERGRVVAASEFVVKSQG